MLPTARGQLLDDGQPAHYISFGVVLGGSKTLMDVLPTILTLSGKLQREGRSASGVIFETLIPGRQLNRATSR
jgi:hypothetical protein